MDSPLAKAGAQKPAGGLISVQTRIVEKLEAKKLKLPSFMSASVSVSPTPVQPSVEPATPSSSPTTTIAPSPPAPPSPTVDSSPSVAEPAPASKVLLIAVMTAPDHFDQRAAIRATWKGYLDPAKRFLSDRRREQTDIFFFIGELNHSPRDNTTNADQLDRQIWEEKDRHGDIIRLDGFVEDYANLTLKTLSVAEWGRARQYGSVFKTDDDSFVRVDQLWDAMDRMGNGLESAYMAHCSFDFPVNQDPDSKNYMYDTYPHDTLPLLCHGGGYLLGHTLVEYIAAHRSDLPKHRNEDVAVSLWLTGPDSKAPRVLLEPNLPVTFFWEECNPGSVYLNPMRTDDMYTAWLNVNKPAGDVCADNFQLREFLDLLDQLQEEERKASGGK